MLVHCAKAATLRSLYIGVVQEAAAAASAAVHGMSPTCYFRCIRGARWRTWRSGSRQRGGSCRRLTSYTSSSRKPACRTFRNPLRLSIIVQPKANHKFADGVAVKSGDATAATSPRCPHLLLSIAALVPLQVARALQAMHSLQPQPLIHRDVKPHNVLLRLRSADGGNSRRRGRCAVLGAQPV